MLVGVAVVVVGLAMAIAKPWDGDGRSGETDIEARPPAVAATASADVMVPGASADPDVAPAARVVPADPTDPWTAVGMLAALGDQGEWGVAALTDGPMSSSRIPTYSETWQRAVPTSGGPVAPMILRASAPVRALAVTAPVDDVPLAVRAWTLDAGGAWIGLTASRPTSARGDADLILLPPAVEEGRLDLWPAGRYRIDLLLGQRVERIDLSILAPPTPAAGVGTEPRWAPVDRGRTGSGESAAAWLALGGGFVTGSDAPPPLLEAARRYAPVAGHAGLAITDSSSGSVRHYDAVPSIGCGDEIIGDAVSVLGITHDPGAPPSSVAMLADGPLGRTANLRLRSTREVVPGLTLVAPLRAATFPDGVYRLVLGGPDGPRTTIVCLGTAPFQG